MFLFRTLCWPGTKVGKINTAGCQLQKFLTLSSSDKIFRKKATKHQQRFQILGTRQNIVFPCNPVIFAKAKFRKNATSANYYSLFTPIVISFGDLTSKELLKLEWSLLGYSNFGKKVKICFYCISMKYFMTQQCTFPKGTKQRYICALKIRI